jgi:hypothetical protein
MLLFRHTASLYTTANGSKRTAKLRFERLRDPLELHVVIVRLASRNVGVKSNPQCIGWIEI